MDGLYDDKEWGRVVGADDARGFKEWCLSLFSDRPEGFWPCSATGTARVLRDLEEARSGKSWVPPGESRYLCSFVEFVQQVTRAFDLQRELSLAGVGRAWSLPNGSFVAPDMGRLVEDFKTVPVPNGEAFNLVHLQLSAAPFMTFTNENWGSNDPSARTILDFLGLLDPDLVIGVHVVFKESPRNVNFGPLQQVLAKWKCLSELTFSCRESFDMGTAMEDLGLGLNPRALRLTNWPCLTRFPRLARFDGLEHLSLVLPQDLDKFPVHVAELCGALPRTVQKFTLRVSSYDNASSVAGLNLCLKALPIQISHFELCGIDFWDNEEAIGGILGHDRFKKISLYMTENTCMMIEPRECSQLVFDTVSNGPCAIEVLDTGKISWSIALVIGALKGLEHVTFATPFFTKFAHDLDWKRAEHAVKISTLKTITYGGIPTDGKTLELERITEHRPEQAEQRARSLIFSCEQRQGEEGKDTCLGGIPMHVLQSCAVSAGLLFADDNQEYNERVERAREIFKKMVRLVNEQKWLEEFPVAQKKFEDIVERFTLFKDYSDWISALRGILCFLNRFVKARVIAFTQTMVGKVSILQDKLAEQTQRKRTLESASANKRGGKQLRKE